MTDSVLWRSIRNQRRAVLLALGMCVAAMWIAVPMGHWDAGLFAAAGILLGLLNHIGTEFSLTRAVEGGGMPDRRQYAFSAFTRLMLITVLALSLAAGFWPTGVTVLVGLALFHLVALVLTGLPLLKEIREA